MTEDTAIRIDPSTLQSVYTWNHKITIIDTVQRLGYYRATF
jgi:hypothetical protein